MSGLWKFELQRGEFVYDEFRNLDDEVYLTLVTWIYDPFDQISDHYQLFGGNGVIVGSQKIG